MRFSDVFRPLSRRAATALLTAALLPTLSAPALAAPARLPVYGYKVVRTLPHDPQAFAQGLFYRDGVLYEGTGLRGNSRIRRLSVDTGQVLQETALPPDVFGEGITDWGDRLIALTWQEQTAFVLDLKSFKVWRKFSYAGEGWGLTHNDKELILSDGTPELRFLDPLSFKELRRVKVTANGRPVERLNELEWVDGEIFANIWQTDLIARIDPRSGRVNSVIDLSGLLPDDQRVNADAVLNGIAYDRAGKRLFVTGKLWPRMFEIQLVEKKR